MRVLPLKSESLLARQGSRICQFACSIKQRAKMPRHATFFSAPSAAAPRSSSAARQSWLRAIPSLRSSPLDACISDAASNLETCSCIDAINSSRARPEDVIKVVGFEWPRNRCATVQKYMRGPRILHSGGVDASPSLTDHVQKNSWTLGQTAAIGQKTFNFAHYSSVARPPTTIRIAMTLANPPGLRATSSGQTSSWEFGVAIHSYTCSHDLKAVKAA